MTSREKKISVVFGIVFFILLIKMIMKPKEEILPAATAFVETPSKEAAEVGTVPEQGWNVNLEELITQIKVRQEKHAAHFDTDPFRKLDKEQINKNIQMEVSDLILSGIIWEQDEPVALINGEILKKGDSIAGFVLEEIRQTTVVLTRGLERYIVRLFNE